MLLVGPAGTLQNRTKQEHSLFMDEAHLGVNIRNFHCLLWQSSTMAMAQPHLTCRGEHSSWLGQPPGTHFILGNMADQELHIEDRGKDRTLSDFRRHQEGRRKSNRCQLCSKIASERNE